MNLGFRGMFVFIFLLSFLFNASFAAAASIEDFDKVEPTNQFRAKVYFSTHVDEKERKIYPRVTLREVNWETGRVFWKDYDYPEYAVKIPQGFAQTVVANNKVWASDTEVIHFGDYIANETSRCVYCTEAGTIYADETGLKSYHVYAEEYYVNKHTGNKTLTRPPISTLYEFDFTTKKLNVIKRVEDDNLYVGNALPSIGLYSIRARDTLNYHSLKTHDLVFSIPRDNPNDNDESFLYREVSGWDWENAAPPELGDYIFPMDKSKNQYIIARTNGSIEPITLVKRNSLHWQKQIGNSIYEDGAYEDENGEKFGAVYLTQDGDKKVISTRKGDTITYFSPNNKYVLNYTRINGEYTNSQLDIYDAVSYTLVGSHVNYAVNRAYGYEWMGESILIKSQGYVDGETDLPYLHIPTGIQTQKNNSLNRSTEHSFGKHYYNFEVDDLITFSDPIEVNVKGKSVKYTGQGTFLTEDNTAYIPLRDFVTSLGGSLDVTGTIAKVKYNEHAATVDLADAKVIQYAGRAYVPIWDIAPKLGFTSEFQEPTGQSKAPWRRFILQ